MFKLFKSSKDKITDRITDLKRILAGQKYSSGMTLAQAELELKDAEAKLLKLTQGKQL